MAKKIAKQVSKSKVSKPAAKPQQQAQDFDDTNRGVLFTNDKDGNEARPDYTGKINVDGVEKRLAAWIAESDKVGQYLKIQVSDFQTE